MKNKNYKFRNLASTNENSDYFDFPEIFKKLRQEKLLSRKQIAEKIGKTIQQVQRYETNFYDADHQNPPLDVFKKLCLILQVDANTLLGLKWINEDVPADVGVIFDWELKNEIALHWVCPMCHTENITYNDGYKKNKELIYKHHFQCEYSDCGAFFDTLKRK